MIEFVYGAKGSGKTKKMIDMANAELQDAKGDILFINDRDKYRLTVDNRIRFVNTEEFAICGVNELYGFISGVIAGNYDVSIVYVDNLLRILDVASPEDVEPFLQKLTYLQKQQDIKFVLSISCDADAVPEIYKKY